jgi:hypothetical protein
LKDKFKTITKRSEQVQILTILPQSYSVRKIEREFRASNYMVRKVQELVQAKGILTTHTPNPDTMLNDDAVKLILNFMMMKEEYICMGKKILHSAHSEFYDDEGRIYMYGEKDFALCSF